MINFSNSSINNVYATSNNGVRTIRSNFISGGSNITIPLYDSFNVSLLDLSNNTVISKSFQIFDSNNNGYQLSEIKVKLNNFFNTNVDPIYNISFKGSSIDFIGSTDSVSYDCVLVLKINVILNNSDFNLVLTSDELNWKNFLGFTSSIYDLSNSPINGTIPLRNNLILLNANNNFFSIKPIIDDNGGVFT